MPLPRFSVQVLSSNFPARPGLRLRRWSVGLPLAVLMVTGVASAGAAATASATPAGSTASAPPPSAGEGARECLKSTQRKLAALAPRHPRPKGPEAASSATADGERIQSLQQLQVICQQRVELAYEQERARQQQQQADEALAAWHGLEPGTKPDFAALMALQLNWRENLNQLDAQQQLAQIVGKQLPVAKSALEDRQLRARVREQVLKGSSDAQADGAADAPPDPQADGQGADGLARQSEVARLALDVAANQYVYLKDSYQLMQARQHILETQGRLWHRKLVAVRQDPRLQFGADYLRQVQADLQREADGLQQRMQRLAAQKATLFEALTRPAANAAGAASGRPGAVRVDAQFDALSRQWQLLQLHADLNRGNLALWQARYRLYNGSSDPAAPGLDLDRMEADLAAVERFLGTELELLISRAVDPTQSLPGRRTDQPADPSLRAEVLVAQRQLHATQTNLQILRDEMAARRPKPRQDAVSLQKSVVERVTAAFHTIWNFELFSAEDSLNINGERVVTTRSVTIGKSVGAVLLLLVGYLGGSFVIERVSRLLVRRLGLSERPIRRIGVWIKVFMGISLLVLSISLVRIPLSVFALSGGMLAVGVGFGAQNLIKNTISSLILFLIRPIKSGDFVQVDRYTGTIKSMGWQFCVVRSIDGKENIIPNAMFLTSPVTNWTYTNTHVRRSVTLAVSREARPQQVLELLQAQTRACPGVLPKPAPVAQFTEFGAGSLGFEVDFWIDMGVSSPVEVDSNLRVRLNEALRDAGIEPAAA